MTRRMPGPSPSPSELVALAGQYAELVRAGCLPDARADAAGRTVRLGADSRAELWLRVWAPGESTGLNDRGAAAGALAVVTGGLREYVPTGWSDGWMWLRPVEHAQGTVAAFARHHVHDLLNPADVPAVTVHACTPPARPVRRYDVVNGDLLEIAVHDELQWAS